MEEEKTEIPKKNNKTRYLIAIILTIIAISILVFITRNLYLSTLTKPVENGIGENKLTIIPTTIDFDSTNNLIKIKKTQSLNFNINDVNIIDDYNNKTFTFELSGDFLSSFDLKKYDFKNTIFNGLQIKNNGKNKTQLIISENDIYGFDLKEDTDFYYIKGGKPSEIYKHIVIVDPGHGGIDPGCEGFGFNEKDICFDIAKKVDEYMANNKSIKVYLTRTEDKKISLSDRVNFATNLGDVFVSIHINANEDYPSINGTEVYYYPKDYEGTHYITGQECAELLCDSITMKLGSRRRENKKENYEVLATATIPAVLCEIGFISNEAEAKKLASKEGINKSAMGIVDGIERIFKVIEYNEKNQNK